MPTADLIRPLSFSACCQNAARQENMGTVRTTTGFGDAQVQGVVLIDTGGCRWLNRSSAAPEQNSREQQLFRPVPAELVHLARQLPVRIHLPRQATAPADCQRKEGPCHDLWI